MSGINLPFLLRCVMLLWKGCLSVEMTQSLATGFPWKTLGTTWLSFESTFLQTDNSMWVCLNSHPQPYHSPKAIPNVCSCDNKRTDTQSCVEILADILAKFFDEFWTFCTRITSTFYQAWWIMSAPVKSFSP